MTDKIELPEKIDFYPLQKLIYEAFHLSREIPEIRLKLEESITELQKVTNNTYKWRQLMFTIANQIN